jgi:hypothetical protein
MLPNTQDPTPTTDLPLSPHHHSAITQILNYLEHHKIPYQITGGCAAALYGARRDVVDLDFDVPAAALPQIAEHYALNIIYGPARYIDEHWQVTLLTLELNGISVDFTASEDGLIFDSNTKKWLHLEIDLSQAKAVELAGRMIQVVPLKELIAYKKTLAREVDLLDIAELTSQKEQIEGLGPRL